ncbi:MAG: transporter [Chloroflexota bacterium]
MTTFERITPLLATLALSGICVGVDYFLKIAGESERPFLTKAFLVGASLYTLSAFGWVYVLQHAKLATVGALFCVVVVVLLALLGVYRFHESLSVSEIVGLGCAVAALLLLGRFA